MQLSPIIELLTATGEFRLVGGLLQLAELQAEPLLALPAAFVIPDSESATPTQSGSNIFEQLVTTLFAVVIVVGADGARRGAAQASLHSLEAAVIAALAGQPVAGADRPMEYADARLVGLSGGRVSRLLRFRVVHRIRVIRNPT